MHPCSSCMCSCGGACLQGGCPLPAAGAAGAEPFWKAKAANSALALARDGSDSGGNRGLKCLIGLCKSACIPGSTFRLLPHAHGYHHAMHVSLFTINSAARQVLWCRSQRGGRG